MNRTPRITLPLLALAFLSGVPTTALAQFSLVQTGGTFRTDATNLAAGGTAFSSSEIGVAPHTTAGLNDGVYGNSSSWIGDGSTSSAGILLGTGSTLSSFAFGRDNTSVYSDRSTGNYTFYYTTDPGLNSGNALSANWTSLGSLTYPGTTSQPSLCNLYNLDSPVSGATGFRIVSPGGTAIDEIELYSTTAVTPPPSPGVSNLAAGALGGITRAQNQFIGQAFTTGTGAGFHLDHVTLGFGSGTGPMNFSVTLRANTGGNLPGEVLATLSGPTTVSSGLLNYSAEGVTLDPETMYWVTWGFTSGTGNFLTNTGSGVTEGAWTLYNRYAVSFNDTTWFESSQGYYMQFAVAATAIPEPSTYAALAGLAALGLALWRRQKTRGA